LIRDLPIWKELKTIVKKLPNSKTAILNSKPHCQPHHQEQPEKVHRAFNMFRKKTPAPHILPSDEESTDLSTVHRTPPNTTLLGTSEHSKTKRQPRGATAKETPWETAEEQWRNMKTYAPRPKKAEKTVLHTLNRIPYGGKVPYMGRLVDVLNTCNLDNPMQITYMMYKVFSPVKEYIDSYNQSHPLKTEAIQNCLNQIDRGDFQLARRFMYAYFIGMDLLSIRDGDLTESEQRFLDSMSYLISCNQKRMCESPKCNLLSTLLIHPASGFVIRHPSLFVTIVNKSRIEPRCEGCHTPNCETWYE
jgi:hypothetical protein